MNINFELALSMLANDPTDLVAWSVILDAFENKVSNTRSINGKSLTTDITLDLDSADFANQGTVTTVLHGNVAGNPSWGPVITADITNANVTLAKIQDITTSRILGRLTTGSGTIEQLTGTQLTTLLDVFATAATTKGLVPGSNSLGATYYLNGAGAWTVPAGSGAHDSLTHLSYAEAGHTGFEPTLAAGTTAQYYRGDKTWQTLTSALSLNHNDTLNKDGGEVGYYGHLKAAEKTVVDRVINIGATTVPTGLHYNAPLGITTALDGTQTANIELEWDAIATDTFDHYLVRYKKSSYTYYNPSIVSYTNIITIDGLVPGLSYDFSVASTTRYGQESAFCLPLTQVLAADTTPPAQVSGVTALGGLWTVSLKWSANTEADLKSYTIFRNTTNDSATSTPLLTLFGTSFDDSTGVTDTPYYYWLKATDFSGNSSALYSTVVTATPRGFVNADNNVAHQGWVQTCVFTATDADTVSWGAGTFTPSNGTVYNISAGNTGNMVARTYIYIDLNTSITAYQITTNKLTAVGDDKVLVASAKNDTADPPVLSTYYVFGGTDNGIVIDGASILAESITANEIAANTITASLIEAGTITATEIDVDTITSLNYLTIGADQIEIYGTTTFHSLLQYKGVYDAAVTYKANDQVIYGVNYWKYVNVTPGAGHTPAEDAYWDALGAPTTTIDGSTITAGTVNTSILNFTPILSSAGTGDIIATINASTEDGGLNISAARININGSTTFESIGTEGELRIFPNANTGLQIVDELGNDVFKAIIGGADVGDIIIGNYAAGHGIKYDSDLDTTTFYGTVYGINSELETNPVGAGDLSGTIVSVPMTSAGARQDKVAVSAGATPGSNGHIVCNGVERDLIWDTDYLTTVSNFYTAAGNVAAYAAVGVTLTYLDQVLMFTADTAGVDFTPGGDTTYTALFGDMEVIVTMNDPPNIVPVNRKDTVTLTGTSGEVDITCNTLTRRIRYNTTGLTATAADFASVWLADYLSLGLVPTRVDVTSSGADIIFTSDVISEDFTGATSRTNIPNTYRGSIKLQGNEMWEDDVNSDTTAFMTINRKGYNGGLSKYRGLYIGNGRGEPLIFTCGASPAGYTYIYGHYLGLSSTTVDVLTSSFVMGSLPTAPGTLPAGTVYRDGAAANATLKVV